VKASWSEGAAPQRRSTPMRECELVIVGAGVAGLTAATFAGRHGLDCVVVEQLGAGGQIANAERIENFPGFPQGIGGHELGPLLQEQAEAAGATFILDSVERLETDGDHRIVRGASESLRGPAIIIAAGSRLRALPVAGAERFLGKGVSHCASCDGALFAGQDVCVIGGGDSAFDEALVLAAHASRVTILHRAPRPDAQRALSERVGACGRIEIIPEAVVEDILGEGSVSAVRWRHAATGAVHTRAVRGVFVYLGLEPNTAFLRDMVALDAAGHIETDTMMRTSLRGVFAAGDIRRNSVAQLAAAAGDGATAAIAAFRYLRNERGNGG
jgi:thioredoxin reductase (NADPH)